MPTPVEHVSTSSCRTLNARYRELARSLALASDQSPSSDLKNRLVADLKASACDSLANVRLFAKGAALVEESDAELGAQLRKHLCKTLVAHLANKILCYLVWTSEDVSGGGENAGASKVVEEIVGSVKGNDAGGLDIWEHISPEVCIFLGYLVKIKNGCRAGTLCSGKDYQRVKSVKASGLRPHNLETPSVWHGPWDQATL